MPITDTTLSFNDVSCNFAAIIDLVYEVQATLTIPGGQVTVPARNQVTLTTSQLNAELTQTEQWIGLARERVVPFETSPTDWESDWKKTASKLEMVHRYGGQKYFDGEYDPIANLVTLKSRQSMVLPWSSYVFAQKELNEFLNRIQDF